MKKITCPNCQEKIELGKNFCPECGYKFEYSIVDKNKDKKEEVKPTQTKKTTKVNPKEEKRIAIHFILFALITHSKNIINSYLISTFHLGFGTLIRNPITQQYTNPMTLILNTLATLYIVIMLCMNVSKNKVLNVLGFTMNILYCLIAIVTFILFFLYFGINIFIQNVPYIIACLLPIIILLITQIIYIAKKRD